MSDDGQDDGYIVRKWRTLSRIGRAFVGVITALGAIGSVFAVGWASHDRWSAQQGLPARVDTLERLVTDAEMPRRLRAVETDVRELRETQRERRKRLQGLQSDIRELTGLATRILCKVENPEATCIDPGNGS